MKTAVVLSGGGAKGAYQIGVWKALRKLGINYDIVTGTSVGALNGVLMVQQDFHSAINLWTNIDYNFVFDKEKVNLNQNIYLSYVKEFIKDGGMNVSKLEDNIDSFLDKKRFFASNIDYGIVTYNLSKMKKEILTKNDLNPQNIKDYIIASATCYPAFKIKKINDEKYIDGGYYDTLPINLAIELGADRIIAVDLKAPGIRQKIKYKNKEIISIIPNNNIGSFLKFDKYVSRRNIKYGYNDTLKAFGKFVGKKYTFYKIPYNFFVKSVQEKFNKNLNNYFNEHKTMKEQLKMILSKLILNYNKSQIIDVIEFTGGVLKIEDTKIHFLNCYNYLLKKEFKKIPAIDEMIIKEKINKKDFDSLLGSKYIVKYIYQILKNKKKYMEIYSLVPIFKKEFLSAMYLISIGC